jgi:hypothetical protein
VAHDTEPLGLIFMLESPSAPPETMAHDAPALVAVVEPHARLPPTIWTSPGAETFIIPEAVGLPLRSAFLIFRVPAETLIAGGHPPDPPFGPLPDVELYIFDI